MEVTNETLTIKAGKILEVSLNTFMQVILFFTRYSSYNFIFQILQKSYSVLAVLRNF